MANQSIRLAVEPLRGLLYSSLSTSFIPIGSALSNPTQIYTLENFTDVDLVWSWNGTDINGILGANGGSFVLDITTNKGGSQEGLYIPKGLITYIAYIPSSAPTSGSVYLTVFYSASL